MERASFFRFSGRANRTQFWKFVLIVQMPIQLAVGGVMAYLAIKYGSCRLVYSQMSFLDVCWFCLCAVALVLVTVLSMPITVRRLHDLNLSGWWLLLILGLNSIKVLRIPLLLIFVVVMGCIRGTQSHNRFGDCVCTKTDDFGGVDGALNEGPFVE